ncbi:hypothetical protein [Chloroflexus aggregans]|uniref:Uncharacterized protein n=1 Tax=Chloroflexus aggregans (strain MD-66 / DSM 9485) TaxID=326427 RepID=B8G6X9_CHLAD|nr:hypothetical protein [Chloroflexus aggregans]ACL25938.1 conserved hypothetical protein [Chloroflexus aggregans DSM 9485]
MDTLTWQADPELCALLRSYYQGEAGRWPTIIACVEQELRARQLPPAPRYVRFRRTNDGYLVEIRPAQ